MKKVFLSLVTVLLTFTSYQVQAQTVSWDAAKCMDIINIISSGGDNLDGQLRGYTLVNNITHDDGYGFVSLYSKNARVAYNGDLLGLSGKGVSNIIMINQRTDGYTQYPEVVTSFFSAANATKFRNQMIELGFTKSEVKNGSTFYKSENVPALQIQETKDRMGKYTLFMFTFKVVM